MAEPTKQPEPVKLDWPGAEAYLKQVKDKIFSYTGQLGMNPYIWWRDNDGPEIEKALAENSRDPGLHSKIMSLRFSEPKVTQKGFTPTKDKA